ncbi:hypothetical protein [Microbacterium lacticum]
MSRTLNVVRMQLANRETFVWVPLLILGSSFVISLIIWGIIAADGVTTNMYGGGARHRCGTSSRWGCRPSR